MGLRTDLVRIQVIVLPDIRNMLEHVDHIIILVQEGQLFLVDVGPASRRRALERVGGQVETNKELVE